MKELLFSDDCWMKDTCARYTHPDCECKSGNIYCPKLAKLDILYNSTLLDMNQRKKVRLFRWDDESENAFKVLKDFEDNIDTNIKSGKNLNIYSHNCGNGKTSWAVRMIQSYLLKIYPWASIDTCHALFISVPRYLLALKASISNQNDYIDHIKMYVTTADLVVWDDIATKSLTEFENENLLSIIDMRMNAGKSNIFTSNMNEQEMRMFLKERLYSRIIGNSTSVELIGSDNRGRSK